jgi:hypothetical protein
VCESCAPESYTRTAPTGVSMRWVSNALPVPVRCRAAKRASALSIREASMAELAGFGDVYALKRSKDGHYFFKTTSD